jgi:murein L,D-transpeptidase YafK
LGRTLSTRGRFVFGGTTKFCDELVEGHVKKTSRFDQCCSCFLAAGALWANGPISPLPAEVKADLLVVNKGQRELLAYAHGQLLRSYRVSLGRDPAGTKIRQGDRKTPEGEYMIDGHNPRSSFHRALHVSYPSAADVGRAESGGYDPGGEIMVHGIHNGLGWIGKAQRLVDWTTGCIAVTDQEIEELYRVVPDGTRIEIRP